ncbi:ribosomal-protein-alanine acetyltransferase [Bacteroidia bacterium]|nr:ribosomal-protein-alanine acetyltransferase [Bacteroidia bacterium]
MFEQLSNLHKLCFPEKPWSAVEFQNLKNSGCEIICSDHGFIVYRTVADEAEIISLGVHPDFRGQGIASAMLALLGSELKKPSIINKVFLEVKSNNDAAIRLYKASGYITVGARPKYYDGIDGVIMSKTI